MIKYSTDAMAVIGGDCLSWAMNSFSGIPFHRTEDPQIFCGGYANTIMMNFLSKHGALYEMKSDRAMDFFDKDGVLLFSWSLHQKMPETDLGLISQVELTVVYHSGMPWVVNNFDALPLFKNLDAKSPHIWAGDFAKFIAGQLPAVDGQQ